MIHMIMNIFYNNARGNVVSIQYISLILVKKGGINNSQRWPVCPSSSLVPSVTQKICFVIVSWVKYRSLLD